MKYSMDYTQAKLANELLKIERNLRDRFVYGGPITDTTEQRDWQKRIEEASLGRNTVMFGDGGYPAVMVRFPAVTLKQLNSSWPDQVHPAFIVNGKIKPEIWIAKYKSAYVGTGASARVVSLRGMDPGNSETFDSELTRHKQMGTGFHLQTLAEHALVALLCKAQGYYPRGNNNFSRDVSISSETGNPTHHYDTSKIGRTATGTGPFSWYHDGTPFGLADVNGNVWERVGGMRLVDGEIQIIPDNNAADNTVDQSDTSNLWKAILQDGSLVAPGTGGTLKFDNTTPGNTNTTSNDVGGDPQINTIINNIMYPPGGDVSYGYSFCTFETLSAASGITIPNILKYYALFPVDNSHGGDGLWVRNYGKRRPLVGGSASGGSSAGVFALFLFSPASIADWAFGARLAFVL
ncbi:hypothetical protein [Caloramator sp. Dgby_cultured_2]|uniref:hypothetical protein n=1 Tax=Caloramator sp. Dgby_cultured_2 TaxID=3029174 RepID=UPI00237E0EFE|nr:hypothetical protein [Caloramator sp. Dgby_cultured_2]WDU82265.1 hypothetical protein PWK10_11200 [Caloramator sp. Dgby_cultured_2]